MATKKPTAKRRGLTKKPKQSKESTRRPKCGSPAGGTVPQSLAFSKTKHAEGKPKWTAKRAKSWAKKKGYRYGKVDEKPGEYRLRQFEPQDGCEYRSVPFGESGVRAVVELPSHVRREVTERLAGKNPRRR